MNNKHSTPNEGLGLMGLVTIVCVALKLANVISATWSWVLLPLWLPFMIAGFSMAVSDIIGIIRGTRKS